MKPSDQTAPPSPYPLPEGEGERIEANRAEARIGGRHGRHAVVIAGGSGTRLWPMSRASLPKQLLPFIGGRSLLEIAFDRLEGIVPAGDRLVCAGRSHDEAIRRALPQLADDQFLGEPCGRDTLNAVGFCAAILARRDPDAIFGVFTADHIIEPVDQFRAIVAQGFELVERRPNALVTFGIAPSAPATGYGYLELGEPFEAGAPGCSAFRVKQFREKPDRETAERYFKAGPQNYLWNSGMFIWRARTLLGCIRRFAPENHAGLMRIADAWDRPDRMATLEAVYPSLPKISVDYAVMEPASRDDAVGVAAIPMPLHWLDVGSWPSFAETCAHDEQGNASAGRTLFLNSRNTLAASSEPGHLITAVGCDDLLIIHTPDATLVCRADQADAVKDLHRQVGERFGGEYL